MTDGKPTHGDDDYSDTIREIDLLIEAREIAAFEGYWSADYREQILRGELDETPCVRYTLAGLKAALRRPTAPEPGEGEVRWSWGYSDGVPGTPEYEPPRRVCNWCGTVETRCQCGTNPPDTSALVGLLREREKIGIERAIDIALTARLPKERWSCSDDASGTALTLSRQRMFIRDELKAEITRIDTALASEGGSDA